MIKNRISNEHKFMFYYAYFYSKIQYGIEIYGTATSTTLDKLQKQQNRCLKILFNKDYFTPTKSLHKELKVPLVTDIFKKKFSNCFLRKC